MTAVQVTKVQQPSEWQKRYAEMDRKQKEFLQQRADAAARG